MEVSIAIVSFNVAPLLDQCLLSIRSQTACQHEVIVVDNASSDQSVSLVKERHPDVTLLENRKNVGFAKANNQAIRRTRGRFILLLNPDTIVQERAVDRLLAFMDLHPEAGACGPENQGPDGSLQHNCHRFPALYLRLIEHLQLQRCFPGHPLFGREHFTNWDYGQDREVDWITGCSLMFRREVLDTVGLFDENYFLYSEEMDLCYRTKRAGWKILFTPSARIVHLGGQSALQQTARGVFSKTILTNLYLSRYYFLRKNYGYLDSLAFRTLDLFCFSLMFLKNLLRIDEGVRKLKLAEYGTVLRVLASSKLRT